MCQSMQHCQHLHVAMHDALILSYRPSSVSGLRQDSRLAHISGLLHDALRSTCMDSVGTREL